MGQASAFGGSIRRRFRAVDAVHFPLSVMIPPVRRVPAVTTVLDVQHELLPEFFSPAERVYRRIVYGWTVRQSRLVVTISHHAAATIVEHLQVEEERVRPIYFGIDHDRFFPGSDARGEFLLYPALGWPHKNHGRLFEAMAILRSRYPGLEHMMIHWAEGMPPKEFKEQLSWFARDVMPAFSGRR